MRRGKARRRARPTCHVQYKTVYRRDRTSSVRVEHDRLARIAAKAVELAWALHRERRLDVRLDIWFDVFGGGELPLALALGELGCTLSELLGLGVVLALLSLALGTSGFTLTRGLVRTPALLGSGSSLDKVRRASSSTSGP